MCLQSFGVPRESYNDVIYLDFAKAFDKVPKERLLRKVRAHGVRGRVLGWIRSWLSGRKQKVVLNGKFSSWLEVLSGVPQGSVLGPLLFVIFINDMDDTVEHLTSILRKFADDTKLGKKVRMDKERQELQEALDKLCHWADRWGMEFNVSKCKVMHMRHANQKHHYYMNSQQLEKSEEEMDISVMITSNLKPSAQCAKAARTAQGVLGQITRAFHYRDRHVFMRLYCVQAVCQTPPGVLHPGLVPLDGDGQVLPGKSAAAGSETVLRSHLCDIRGKTAGAWFAHPGGKTTSSGHVHGA
jgi:ribonuclease P/MRP protein subunit RPP40